MVNRIKYLKTELNPVFLLPKGSVAVSLLCGDVRGIREVSVRTAMSLLLIFLYIFDIVCYYHYTNPNIVDPLVITSLLANNVFSCRNGEWQ